MMDDGWIELAPKAVQCLAVRGDGEECIRPQEHEGPHVVAPGFESFDDEANHMTLVDIVEEAEDVLRALAQENGHDPRNLDLTHGTTNRYIVEAYSVWAKELLMRHGIEVK